MAEAGNTDFTFKEGKLQLKLTYAFRIFTVLLLVVSNITLFVLSQKFVSKVEYKETDNKMDILKSSINSLQRDMAIMSSRTIDIEQDRRISELENRIRSLERKTP